MEKILGSCPSCHALNKIEATDVKKQPICGKCKTPLAFHDLVQDVTTEEFDKIVRNSSIPIIVDFWASWCGPCKQYGPTFQMVSNEYGGHVQFLKVNTEKNQDLAARLGVRGIPATMMIKDGKITGNIAGAMNYDQLRSWVEQNK